MVWLCGVDGFKSKWCAVLRNLDTGEFRYDVVPFQTLLNVPENPAIIATSSKTSGPPNRETRTCCQGMWLLPSR